jgi:DNA-binding NtrC family response regulator
LESYSWPGNIRELRNIIERVIILEKGKQIDRTVLENHLKQEVEYERNLPVVAHKTADQAERELIYRALLDIRMAVEDIHEFILGQRPPSFERTEFRPPPQAEVTSQPSSDTNLALKDMEKNHIEKALERYNGNRRRAARALGIGERTLYRKLKEYGLE